MRSQISVLCANTDQEIDAAFEAIAQEALPVRAKKDASPDSCQ